MCLTMSSAKFAYTQARKWPILWLGDKQTLRAWSSPPTQHEQHSEHKNRRREERSRGNRDEGACGLVVSGCFSCSDRVRNLHSLARNAVGKLGSWFGVAHGAQS